MKNFNAKIFAKKLKESRLDRKISQRELAKRTGLLASNICHFEQGNRLPNLRNLYKLCVALNISANYLLNIKDFI
jgi:transcriptional regulator with XRE-family HTH domain